MKILLFIVLMGLTLSACKKDKSYLSFTEQQLEFVNYENGQILKFLDTTYTAQTLTQKSYRREFRERTGVYGRSDLFTEEYEVSYFSQNSGNLDLYVNLNAYQYPAFNLTFASYQTMAHPDSLTYSLSSATIDGKTYNEVYVLKMYKNGQFLNNNDTATLFHNKQFGVIQLLFPNGSKIIRIQ